MNFRLKNSNDKKVVAVLANAHVSKLLLFFALLLGVQPFLGCENADDPDGVVPTNLKVDITNPNDGSGILFLQATAENATEFEFYFGAQENDETAISMIGNASHTYTESGNYSIEVRALGDGGEYVSFVDEISIFREAPPSGYLPSDGYYTPLSYSGWELNWQDEFAGDELNQSNWNYDIGTGYNGWGNGELQYYREQNTSVEGGYLLIEAKAENYLGSLYTSSRLTTQNKYFFRYGRVDIRAALPEGQGLWPALWMLGASFSEIGWPACGELDIMEMVGGGDGRDDVTHGNIHWDENGYSRFGGSTQLDTGIFYDEFHVFSIIWGSESIIWLLDDVPFLEVALTREPLSEFHGYFFFIMNVAVGGGWPGSPNETTQFPQRMIVDYIRVFQTAG